MDFNPSEKNKFFANYGIEKGASGVPQNEYYSPRGPMGGINVPGGGLISTLAFAPRQPGLHPHLRPEPDQRVLRGRRVLHSGLCRRRLRLPLRIIPTRECSRTEARSSPRSTDYGNDGLPLLLTPDTSFGGIFAKKQVRIAGDNLTKVLGQHTIRGGVFYQWDSNPQVSPFINTNGSIAHYYIGETFTDPCSGAGSTPGNCKPGRSQHRQSSVAETAATSWPISARARSSNYNQDKHHAGAEPVLLEHGRVRRRPLACNSTPFGRRRRALRAHDAMAGLARHRRRNLHSCCLRRRHQSSAAGHSVARDQFQDPTGRPPHALGIC